MREPIQRHLWVTGRVQGVGFRAFVDREAQRIGGLKGWVRNLDDGRVEVLISGVEAAVQELVKQCAKGPALGRVDRLEIREEAATSDLPSFQIQK
ncbi:MAG: acylphosphatase [Bdellovibrionales bacterium]|nr:acylphosphatase [Bdellovibrionales bacterium]